MTLPSNADNRDLQYPLDRSLVAETDTGNETIADPQLSWSTLDNDERVDIVLNISLNEFIGLASCIDVGSDIAYGDDAILLWWTWVRSLSNVDLCEAISDCITNNSGTQTALTQFIQNSGIADPNYGSPTTPMIPTRFPLSERQAEIKAPPAGCDKDTLWAGIREVVQRLDDNGRDFLEDLNVIADKIERVNELIALVPVIGSMLQSITIQFVEVVPDLLTLYNSFSSEAELDNLACELFEIVCNECRYPTYEETIDMYAGGASTEFQGWINLAVQAALIAGQSLIGFGGEVVYRSLITMQLFFMYNKSRFNLAYNQETLGLWASLGEDFPNDNWEALCDGCDEPTNWCWDSDLTIYTNFDWSGASGTQHLGVLSGSEWVKSFDTWSGGQGSGVGVEWALGQTIGAEEIYTEFQATEGTTGAGFGSVYPCRIILFENSTTRYDSGIVTPAFGATNHTYDLTGIGNFNRIRVYMAISRDDDSNVGILEKLEVRGSGSNPFGVDNC